MHGYYIWLCTLVPLLLTTSWIPLSWGYNTHLSPPVITFYNTQDYGEKPMMFYQHIPIKFQSRYSGKHEQLPILTVSSWEAMMMAKFAIRLQLHSVNVSDALVISQPERVHLPFSTLGFQETQMGLSDFCFGWKIRGPSHLRTSLGWIQCAQTQAITSREW